MADVVPLRRRAHSGALPGAAKPAAAPAAPAGAGASRLAEVTTLVREAGLAGLVRPASQPVDAPAATNEVLPVIPALRPLLPWGGLRRGSTIAVGGLPAAPGTEAPSGATSTLLALLSAASVGGSWCAVVGLPALGAVAADEWGICLERLALVPYPGPEWPAVVAALLDGFDVVVAAPPGPVGATVAGRLSARARQRGSALVAAGAAWAGAELVLTPGAGTWLGLGQGRGRLTRRELVVTAQGRGSAARPRQARLALPSALPAPAAPPAPPAPGVDAIPGVASAPGGAALFDRVDAEPADLQLANREPDDSTLAELAVGA